MQWRSKSALFLAPEGPRRVASVEDSPRRGREDLKKCPINPTEPRRGDMGNDRPPSTDAAPPALASQTETGILAPTEESWVSPGCSSTASHIAARQLGGYWNDAAGRKP